MDRCPPFPPERSGLTCRMSGKTQSTCYVEFGTYSDAQRMVQRRNNRALGARNVQLSIVPQEELMEAVFPRFRGEWRALIRGFGRLRRGSWGVVRWRRRRRWRRASICRGMGLLLGGLCRGRRLIRFLLMLKLIVYVPLASQHSLYLWSSFRVLMGSLRIVGSVLNVRTRV